MTSFSIRPSLDFLCLPLATSRGAPTTLRCEESQSDHIQLKDVTFSREKTTMGAEKKFPGIEADSQRACELVLKRAGENRPVQCELDFAGKVIPPDILIVILYQCTVMTREKGK